MEFTAPRRKFVYKPSAARSSVGAGVPSGSNPNPRRVTGPGSRTRFPAKQDISDLQSDGRGSGIYARKVRNESGHEQPPTGRIEMEQKSSGQVEAPAKRFKRADDNKAGQHPSVDSSLVDFADDDFEDDDFSEMQQIELQASQVYDKQDINHKATTKQLHKNTVDKKQDLPFLRPCYPNHTASPNFQQNINAIKASRISTDELPLSCNLQNNICKQQRPFIKKEQTLPDSELTMNLFSTNASDETQNVSHFTDVHTILRTPATVKYASSTEKPSGYQEKLKRLEEESYTKDGEIKMLREALNRAKEEGQTYKDMLVKLEEQRKKDQTEKEKSLEREVEKLKTQLQFKNRELQDAHAKVKESAMLSPRRYKSENSNSPSPVKSDKIRKTSFPSDDAFSHSSKYSPQTGRLKNSPNIPKTESQVDQKKVDNQCLACKQLQSRLTMQSSKKNLNSFSSSINELIVNQLMIELGIQFDYSFKKKLDKSFSGSVEMEAEIEKKDFNIHPLHSSHGEIIETYGDKYHDTTYNLFLKCMHFLHCSHETDVSSLLGLIISHILNESTFQEEENSNLSNGRDISELALQQQCQKPVKSNDFNINAVIILKILCEHCVMVQRILLKGLLSKDELHSTNDDEKVGKFFHNVYLVLH